MRARTAEELSRRRRATAAQDTAQGKDGPATVRGLQRSGGNRATGRAVRGRALQRQPTIDLAHLYAGKGDPTVVADFVRLQALLSDRQASVPHLRLLNAALEERLRRTPLPAGPSAARSQVAATVLDEVLATFEVRCGFSPARPVLVGFASADDFKALTSAGQHFHDVGAGRMHGEFTHRIQWFIAMSAVTHGGFDAPALPFTHSPRELYAAAMDEAYAVDATSVTGRAYMWDWVFDRIAGLRPQGAPSSSDYDPARDAWTHPGETNAVGALSNDILPGGLVGVAALTELRQAQLEGYEAGKSQMSDWFAVAVHLRLAEGQAVTGGPSYFQRALIPGPEAIRELRRGKEFAAGLIGRVRTWASLATLSLSPDTTDANVPSLKRINDDAVYWRTSLRDAVQRQRGSTPLALAMIDLWYGTLMIAVQEALGRTQGITDKGTTQKPGLVPVLAKLSGDMTALEAQPAWLVIA